MDRLATIPIRAPAAGRAVVRRRLQGYRLLAGAAVAAALVFLYSSGTDCEEDPACFVAGLREAVGRDASLELITRGWQPRKRKWERPKWDACTKREYIRRLRHRRWAAQFEWPRIFGYVEKWDDDKGEGIIRDQEKTQDYLVIRDEIGRCFHNHKTLQRAEMVEFFATDEMDEVAGLPLAKNVTGPLGKYVKSSTEYREAMLRFGAFPKRFQDNIEEYEFKKGEWWLEKKYYMHKKVN